MNLEDIKMEFGIESKIKITKILKELEEENLLPTKANIEEYFRKKNGICPRCRGVLFDGNPLLIDAFSYRCKKGHRFLKFWRSNSNELIEMSTSKIENYPFF